MAHAPVAIRAPCRTFVMTSAMLLSSAALAEEPRFTGVPGACENNSQHFFEESQSTKKRMLATFVYRDQASPAPSYCVRANGAARTLLVGIDGQIVPFVFVPQQGGPPGDWPLHSADGAYELTVTYLSIQPPQTGAAKSDDFFMPRNAELKVCRGSDCTTIAARSEFIFDQIF